MNSLKRRNWLLTCKWGLYFLLLLAAATLQTLPGFLTVGGAKPLFILPLCLAVSLCEEEAAASLFAVVGGVLWDYTAGRTIGLLTFALVLVCLSVGILVRVILQSKLGSFLLICGVCALLVCSLDFMFTYSMRGYGGAARQYFTVVVPIAVFTAALSPLSYWVVHAVAARFALPD